MNVVSAAGIAMARRQISPTNARSPANRRSPPRGSAHTLHSGASVALTILLFRNWVHLLAMEEGESVSDHSDAIRLVIAALVPLVPVTTGWRLGRKSVPPQARG